MISSPIWTKRHRPISLIPPARHNNKTIEECKARPRENSKMWLKEDKIVWEPRTSSRPWQHVLHPHTQQREATHIKSFLNLNLTTEVCLDRLIPSLVWVGNLTTSESHVGDTKVDGQNQQQGPSHKWSGSGSLFFLEGLKLPSSTERHSGIGKYLPHPQAAPAGTYGSLSSTRYTKETKITPQRF